MLSWSKNKLATAIKSLQDNGYLKTIQYPKGKGNGFSYNYVISSFGNLKSETEIKTTEEQEEIIESTESNFAEEAPVVVGEYIETPMNEVDFDNYIGSLSSLFDYYGEDYIIEIQPLYSKRDIKTMEQISSKYLKRFYNAEIQKVKNPESNGKAFKALQNWLKNEVFNNKNITNLYSVNNSNINAKFLMYKSKYPISRPVDFETEMAERTID